MTLRQICIGLNILLTALFLLGLAGMFVPSCTSGAGICSCAPPFFI